MGGNSPPKTGEAEQYDGTSWTVSASMANARDSAGGAADNKTTALCFGGRNTSNTPSTFTEEFTGTFNAARVITTS